jgi:hypothetical protein
VNTPDATTLLTAALEYLTWPIPAIPVDADKRPLCKWGEYLTRPQTEDEVRSLPWDRAYGLALVTWPGSELIVLDFDGPCAMAAWKATGIELPPTCAVRTRSGWLHAIYRTPSGTPRPGTNGNDPRRKVRLIKAAGCACTKKCGVDLLLNGYFLTIPTPGYHENPDFPFEQGRLAEIPQAVLDLARATAGTTGTPDSAGPIPESEIARLLAYVPHGEMHAALLTLAGHFAAKLGPREDEILGIIEPATRQWQQPVDLEKVRQTVKGVVAMEQQKRQRSRRGPEPPEEQARKPIQHTQAQPNGSAPPPAAEIAEAPPLQVPEAGMLGIAREFATLYASHLEAPTSFFYFTYLTYLGALLSRQISLVSALDIEPRLYTVLVGESSDTRKSTALRKTDQFFRSLAGYELTVLLGAGSGEGLAKALQESPELLLHYDELKTFVSKAQAESSVLLPMVGSLFERHEYDNRTKEGSISVRGASLSLVAACTQETYSTMFDRRFHAIGFLNRLWLVADRTTTRIAMPPPFRPDVLDRLRDQTISLLKDIQGRYRQKNYQRVEFGLTKGAEAMFTAWYLQRQGTIFEKRLETYGHRLMLLLTAMAGKDQVDEEITTAVVALLRYQLDARRELDPVDAEGTIAILEERVRRTLARGRLSGRELRRRLHPERVGIWMWNTAIENLLHGSRELHWDRKTDIYWLTGVTITVTTPQTGPNSW